MNSSPSRETAQMRTLMPSFAPRVLNGLLTRMLFAGSRKEASSILPRAKSSTREADGKRRMRAISSAAAFSGLMNMERPRSFFNSKRWSAYSGLRMRAMVCLAPSLYAERQARRFSSSEPVTAIKRSQLSISTDFSTAKDAPFPT